MLRNETIFAENVRDKLKDVLVCVQPAARHPHISRISKIVKSVIGPNARQVQADLSAYGEVLLTEVRGPGNSMRALINTNSFKMTDTVVIANAHHGGE